MGMLDVLKVFLSQELEYTNARDLSYSEVACVTVLTWDVLVMLSEEVRPRDVCDPCVSDGHAG